MSAVIYNYSIVFVELHSSHDSQVGKYIAKVAYAFRSRKNKTIKVISQFIGFSKNLEREERKNLSFFINKVVTIRARLLMQTL